LTGTRTLAKAVASLCFVSIITGALLAWKTPATGYEPSIYTATPPLVWGCLIASLICGIGIVVHQVHTAKHEKSTLWFIGLLLIFLVYATLLSLWIIRGYYLWCSGDPLSHLGEAQNILRTGHIGGPGNFYPSTGRIGEGNFYPIAHIYLAEVSSICNLPPTVFHKYLPLIFGILYAPFMYLFARSILPEKGQVILATLASMTFLPGSYLYFTPNTLSNLALPLALFLLVRSFTSGIFQWKMLFIIMVFLFAPFHPIPSIFLLLVLFTIWLPQELFAGPTKSATAGAGSGLRSNLPVLAFFLVWIITWLSSFFIWSHTIRNLYRAISEAGPTPLMGIFATIELGVRYGYSLAAQFFKVYGGILIYAILALVALPILWRKLRSETNLGTLWSLCGPLGAITLMLILLYLSPLGSRVGGSPGRFLIYAVMLCAIFAGFTLYETLRRADSSRRIGYAGRLAPLLVVVVFIAAFANGSLKLYTSRYILVANYQITRTEVAGMDWFLHSKNATMMVTSLALPPSRFADFLLTPEERMQQVQLLDAVVDAHFGYDKRLALGESYAEDIYLVFDEKSKLYQEIFPEVPQFKFLPADFEKLEHDPTVDRLYSNGGLDVYYVHAHALPI
jgi:hypothetical protein